jgi:hypothetical protein
MIKLLKKKISSNEETIALTSEFLMCQEMVEARKH